jgi:tRNA pseudouridine32 synthase/23S rRNA pseudouridine746 synthase
VRPEFTGDIRIVRETDRLVAIDKPAGMLSAPGKGPEKQDCAVARVRERFPRAAGPVLVHRLDMETSGLLVMALDAETHRELSRQFERREPAKRYVAVLAGDPGADDGEVRLFQRPDIENRPRQILDGVHGKEAVTRWRAIQRAGAVTRMEFTPITGRSHQLRLAAATPREQGGLGCPIVGDTLYGGGRDEHPRMLLHAERLEITDPATGERLAFESPAPF